MWPYITCTMYERRDLSDVADSEGSRLAPRPRHSGDCELQI